MNASTHLSADNASTKSSPHSYALAPPQAPTAKSPAAAGFKKGTKRFIAPETCRGEAVPESDVWSLGMTILVLTTGVDPYAHWREPPNDNSGVDPFVAALGRLEVTPKYCLDDIRCVRLRRVVERCVVVDVGARATIGDVILLLLAESPSVEAHASRNLEIDCGL